jgi:signal transduction histidine kinase/CheY-like chemotaxis protein
MGEAHRIALRLSSASADERLARLRSEQEAADQRARADAEARQHGIELKVLQSQKAESLGALAGGMVHHFNNLLTSILGNAELAELDAGLVPEALAEIKVSGRRAADLCRQIMMYAGRSDRRMAAVDLLELVHESSRLMRVTLVTDCEIVCEFPPEPVYVWGDRAQLQQIILNLMTNSAEARATSIGFRASAYHGEPPSRETDGQAGFGDYVELRVTDNGEGMAPEVLARAFEPFFSTKSTGRGLGLPATMGLVRAQQGAIAVESAPGSGTTVRIHLPVSSGIAPAQPRPTAEQGPRRSPRVALVADDEEAVRSMIVKCMTRLGWKTLEAADGVEVVRIHRDYSGQIDLLLCDHQMPRMGGLQAVLQIRRLSPDLPVILMSSFTREGTVDEFRALGLEHFLKKPFQLQDLRDLLLAASAPVALKG